jgi:pimeloyl-ACP methyl ester carboxylesterase
MRRHAFATALAAALGLALVSSAGAAAPDPSQGDGGVSPFYSWDAAIPEKRGAFLRQEELPSQLLLEKAASGLRILYASTDGIDGRTPVVVSGVVFLPKGEAPAGGWPVVAWAHGTTGIADICAPSWRGRSERDVAYLNTWLAQGYAIVASDYQGLGTPGAHPYLATRPEAYSVLDSVRAALAGVPGLANSIVIVGQSQGGAAAFATAGAAPDYAPELMIRGTVATGTPYFSPEATAKFNAASRRDVVDPTIAYTLLIMHFARQVMPELEPREYIAEAAWPIYEMGAKACIGDLFAATRSAALTRAATFKKDPAAVFERAFSYMTYGTLRLRQPLFMGTGEKDRDVPPAIQLQLAKDACAAGTALEAHLYPGLDHGGTVNGSLVDSLPFVRKARAGEPVAGNCAALPSLPAP